MNSRKVLRRALRKSNPKQVAADLGVSLSTIYKWSEEGESGRSNPLERMAALCRSTGDARLVQWLCAELDGCFVPNGRLKESEEPWRAFVSVGRKLANLNVAMMDLLKDGRASRNGETHDLRELWDAFQSEMEWLVRCCESGRWKGLRLAIGQQPVTIRLNEKTAMARSFC